MGPWLPYAVTAVAAGLSAAVAAAILLLTLGRKPARGEGDELQEANARLSRELAVQQERVTRLAAVESALTSAETKLVAEQAAKAQLATELAGASAAGAALEAAGADLKQRLASTETRLSAEIMTSQTALRDLATLKETLEQERLKSDEKLQLLLDAKGAMSQDFQVLANDLMSRHGEAFTKQNKEQLDGLLAPLGVKLKEFQDGLQTAHTETAKDRAALGEQIRQLSEQSAKMTSETVNLTRALKGKVQTQGAWGEMILASLLEKSGLREGEEYVTQSSHRTEDGQRLRPDVIVNLPNNQRVIVDAKVSLVAFETYVNAESDAERDVAAAAHLTSMRNHIKRLASKEYQALAGEGLDYVIMFVPIEGALAVALEEDPSLTSYAVQNNVAIATPTTLMIALRTIENVWQVERRNRNADAIAQRAGHLYSKFVGFIEDMQKLGQRLNMAQSSYGAAMGKLQTGSGNLISQAEKLRELGAKTIKALPSGLVLDDLSELDTAPDSLILGSLEAPSDLDARRPPGLTSV